MGLFLLLGTMEASDDRTSIALAGDEEGAALVGRVPVHPSDKELHEVLDRAVVTCRETAQVTALSTVSVALAVQHSYAGIICEWFQDSGLRR